MSTQEIQYIDHENVTEEICRKSVEIPDFYFEYVESMINDHVPSDRLSNDRLSNDKQPKVKCAYFELWWKCDNGCFTKITDNEGNPISVCMEHNMMLYCADETSKGVWIDRPKF